MEKIYSLPSYKRCDCQGDCFKFGENENEPCWGDVEAIDEIECVDDWYWVHSCQGHWNMYQSNDKYVPEKK